MTAMELHRDTNPATYQITAYQPGEIYINRSPFNHSMLIHPSQMHSAWRPKNYQDITPEDIKQCLSYQPEIVLIGTGQHHQQLPHNLLAPLYEARIGVEVMHSLAACKTFALLSSDQRNVLAAVIIQ